MKNKMETFNKTKKYLTISIVIFILIAVSVSVFIFLINTEKKNIKDLSNQLSIANKEDVVALKRAIRNYETNAELVESLIVDKDQIFTFISEIEDLAKKNGATVSVQNIELFDVLNNGEMIKNSGQDNPDRSHGKFVMNVRVDGNWDSVAKFLLKMENIPRHSVIEALRIVSVFDSQKKLSNWSGAFNIITTTN